MSDEIQQLGQQIAALLAKTFSTDVAIRKTAEDELVKLETSSKLYGLATLYLTRLTDLNQEVHVSAAIAFKNFIRRNWHYDPSDENADQVDKIDGQQRELIKQHITAFMLESPAHIQRQLSEAITIIGQSDFPDKWPSLIVELETYLKAPLNQDFSKTQGVLQTAHSIFRRYRYELQSNRLWGEIKLVIDHFGQPLTDRFRDLVAASKNTSGDTLSVQPIYQSILLCTEIYHSFVTQDLPEFFEDRLNQWLPIFLDLLTVQIKMPDGVTVIEDMKSEICEIASLFVQRYSDAENSKEYTQKFAENIWTLLVTTSQDMKYDTLVSNAIRYLVTVAERPETRPLFQDSNVLNLLCQNVIIPNLTLRETDQEIFEDDPEEYVKRDIEGSDVDTRRRAACDLVQALCKFQEAQLIEVFGRFIQGMMTNGQWQSKDLSIFLYSAMAIKGSTRQHGTVSISQHVDVEKFFEDNIVGELLSENRGIGFDILKADALRYITTFRNHISLTSLSKFLPVIIKHIVSTNIVIRTYASIALEKLLTIRDPTQPKQTAFKPEQFDPLMGELIQTLFQALEMQGSLENEHIMKAIMRLFSFSNSSLVAQFLPIVVPKLTNKLGIVARNPSNPYFNHYLFESLALAIRAACSQDNPAMRNEFENILFNILEVVLAQDVQEFTPYVLQLLNLILAVQTPASVSERFLKLFQDLLSPTHWEKASNIRPLTELMHTFIEKIGQVIIAQNKLDALLGIFQKLIASKATDHEGLALLQTMMIHLPASDLDAKIKDIFVLIFQRLTCSKTAKFVKHVLVIFSTYAYLRGADALAIAVNQLQDKIFGMVLEKLFLAEVKKVTGYAERRICVCGMIKIIGQLPLIENGAYNHVWCPLLLVLLEIFELPQEVIVDEDDHFKDIAESLDFQAQYSRLNYASRKRDDLTKNDGDLKNLLATSLSNLSRKMPGFVPKMISDQLDSSTLRIMEGEKSAKAKAKEEAKRLKMEKFKEKQAKLAELEAQKKDSSKIKESAVEKLTKLTDQLVLEDVPSGEKKDVTTELASSYIPRQVEHSWYSFWEKGGFFKPENQSADAKSRFVKNLSNNESSNFVMVIPPPNVTGTLHIGHALTCAIQDCLVRWNRMRGKTTLWVPGSDHAGIATQVVVEKKIQREMNKSRHDLGRDAFIKEVWKWKTEKGDFIYDQLRKMGCSLDWDRAVFTLDEMMVRAVNEAFVRLKSKGYITRNKRLVNWSCTLKSAISDIEVDFEELTDRKTLQVPGYDKRIEFGVIETFAYEVYNEGKSAIADKIWVSTTRLETMLGDTAIAVHPTDERYKHLHGRYVKHPFCNRQFQIICDEKVEKDFGTGAVKITPAHDHEDYDKGQRHNLEFIDILTDDGLIVDGFGCFSGMKRFDARFAIRAELRKLGLLTEDKPRSNPMKVPICSRSKDIVEPRIKEQWFMDCEEIARRAIELTDQGKLKIPKAHMNIWKRWMDPESLKRHPWCISRQLWWGHRIPAYRARIKGQASYKWIAATNIDDATKAALLELKSDSQHGDSISQDQVEIVQDEDVLDTWFSSGLFPFAVFGWPDKTEDLKNFYPTQLLETGEDILFFWVARMVMLGLALTDQLPFEEVCLHPIVRDADGRKMSKSLGNVIDPLDVISGIKLDDLQAKLKDSNLDIKEFEKASQGQKKLFPQGIPECGTDALRFKLCEYFTPGSGDIHLRIDQLAGDRLLCNKIWQACKFGFITLGDDIKFPNHTRDAVARKPQDNDMVATLIEATEEVNAGLKSYAFRRATIACRKYWRDELCSKYIEWIKDLRKEGELELATKETLFFCLDNGLRLLHPLMPYITEELYQRLMTKYSLDPVIPSICIANFPEAKELRSLFQILD